VRALTRAWVVAGAALCSACAAAQDPEPPTYHDTIAPLLARSCLPCHGEHSPHHSLASYDDVVEHAERALSLMRSGSMPKGNVDRSGACREFTEPVPVSAHELELFEQFVDHGMPEGDPLLAPHIPDPPALARASTVLLSEPYLPATDSDGGSGDHRCFTLGGVDLEAGELRAFRVLPTAPELVHHVMLFALDTDVDAHTAEALDRGAEGPGWPCFGAPGIAAARLVGVWTPGRDVVRFPEGYAPRLGRAGVVVQIHYDGPAPSAPSQVRFELELGTSLGSTRELRFLPFAAVELTLPPERESVRTAHRGRLEIEAGSELLGVYPHMHALGRRLSLHAQLGTGAAVEPTCLVDVPRWDYGFQELALYRAPLPIEVDDPELSIECEHGTLGLDHTVRWGERMEDEMCMAFVVTATP